MTHPPEPQFDFGENWDAFSAHALTVERVGEARRQFDDLVGDIPLKGSTFLDVGFGQGLSLLSAAERGARAAGCDINPKCARVLDRNRHFFPGMGSDPHVVTGSILSDEVVERLRSFAGEGGFNVVHSWGVLHHTGDMRRAIANTAALVAPNGHMVLAIYSRHWSSPIWLAVKLLYVKSPGWLRKAIIGFFYPVVYLAKLFATRSNPLNQQRGMDFYYNLVDWIGGYPYEYASIGELRRMVEGHGFSMTKVVPAEVPTGCNQFVFIRND